MTVKLCENVIPIYNEICSSHQGEMTLTKLGEMTLTKLVLDDNTSCNIINTIKNFLKIFRAKF